MRPSAGSAQGVSDFAIDQFGLLISLRSCKAGLQYGEGKEDEAKDHDDTLHLLSHNIFSFDP
jgi:hypothetical protein